MAAVVKPGWSKPSTILYASEIPANEKAFSYALSQAIEFGAHLILFHAYDTLLVSASETSGIRYYDFAAASVEKEQFEPLLQRVRHAGVTCELIVRPGLPADQIFAFLRERKVDRIVMGTHSPGPIGKLLVGSVAEAVLRSAKVPVCIIGPEVVSGAYRKYATSSVLCAVSLQEASRLVAGFAAEIAAQHQARLILQHVISPHDHKVLDGHTFEQLEAEMLNLVPIKLREKLNVQAILAPGDPTEELLYQSKAQMADLIVLGAHGASAFAAITRHGVVYKLLAHAQCPVITLSPAVMEECGVKEEKDPQGEAYLAGVF